MEGNYQINNAIELENSASNLATYNQKLANNVQSLQYILKTVQENWQNDSGADLQSYINGLNTCISRLSNTIIPVIDKYVNTMNTLAISTQQTQQRTYNGN